MDELDLDGIFDEEVQAPSEAVVTAGAVEGFTLGSILGGASTSLGKLKPTGKKVDEPIVSAVFGSWVQSKPEPVAVAPVAPVEEERKISGFTFAKPVQEDEEFEEAPKAETKPASGFKFTQPTLGEGAAEPSEEVDSVEELDDVEESEDSEDGSLDEWDLDDTSDEEESDSEDGSADEWADEPEEVPTKGTEPEVEDSFTEDEVEGLVPLQDRAFTRPGLTGEVSSFGSSSMSYPCVILEEGFERVKHVMDTLQGFLQPMKGLPKTVEVYAGVNEELLSIGGLTKGQVKPFLSLLEKDGEWGDMKFFLNGDLELEGDMIYVLAG